jgi:hypothetical protein
MNQNFSSQQLLRLCKQHEWEDYGLRKEDLERLIDENFNKIIGNTFAFDFKKVGDYFLTDDLPQKLILRKLNDNLKRLYKDEQSNRRIIIKQVKTLLEENGPMWILKTDIEKFYESIDRDRLISKLKDDSMLSFHSLQLLDRIFMNEELSPLKGIPRGLNISATLSEIYMRKFDRWIRRTTGIYFYASFVDDIVVFGNSENVINEINQNINRNLEKGLRKKIIKTGVYKGDNIKDIKPLEYLGYNFTTSTVKNTKSLKVSIADKKIKKIKTRITLAFLSYLKDNNFSLLENRIKFLTGNYSVKRSIDGNDLKAGIFYNYSHLTDFEVFDTLNEYYRKALFSKSGTFGSNLSRKLDASQKVRLSKYSFKHGYFKKLYNSFTAEQMNNIKDCWR